MTCNPTTKTVDDLVEGFQRRYRNLMRKSTANIVDDLVESVRIAHGVYGFDDLVTTCAYLSSISLLRNWPLNYSAIRYIIFLRFVCK